jgi:hypothetical protein
MQLSAHRAFVIQFDATTAVERGKVVGRVEHVVSGQAMHFQSLETLMAFIAQILRAGPMTTRRNDG